MKNKKILVIMFSLVCLVFSVLITVQLKTVSFNENISLKSSQNNDFQKQLDELVLYGKNLTNKLNETESSLNDLTKKHTINNTAFLELQNNLKKSNMIAGITKVGGPGVIITLTNSNISKIVTPDNKYKYIIQYSDLLALINDLKDYGAEAISINDQRVVSISHIKNLGDLISINNVTTSSPFTIKAIGNKDYLENSLKMVGGTVETLKKYDIGVEIKKYNSITIEKYNKIIEFKYGKSLMIKEE